MVERLRNHADDEGGLNHEKTQAPLESHLLDFPVFGWSGSCWKFVLDPVSGGKNCKLNWRILL